jgi:hypothetical protein
MPPKLPQTDFLNGEITDYDEGNLVAECVWKTNRDDLCRRASSLNNGQIRPARRPKFHRSGAKCHASHDCLVDLF